MLLLFCGGGGALVTLVTLSTVRLASSCETVSDLMIGTLVDCNVSSVVTCNPRAVNIPSAKVSTLSSSFEFVDELVNLNTLVPTLNLTVSLLGIVNVPDTAPFASVVNAPPRTPALGVTLVDTLSLSKKGKTLVLGFNLVALKEIVCERINGMNATSTTRLPKDCVTTFEPAIDLVIPVLVAVPVLPDVVVVVLPDVVLFANLPVQLVCHSFHTVPKLFVPPVNEVIVSNKFSSLITKSGLLSISFHSSVSGVNVISP